MKFSSVSVAFIAVSHQKLVDKVHLMQADSRQHCPFSEYFSSQKLQWEQKLDQMILFSLGSTKLQMWAWPKSAWVFKACANHSLQSSPGSLSHLGTFPGSDLAALGAWVCADGSGSSWVDLLVPAPGSTGGSGSSEVAELEGHWSMQLSGNNNERLKSFFILNVLQDRFVTEGSLFSGFLEVSLCVYLMDLWERRQLATKRPLSNIVLICAKG